MGGGPWIGIWTRANGGASAGQRIFTLGQIAHGRLPLGLYAQELELHGIGPLFHKSSSNLNDNTGFDDA